MPHLDAAALARHQRRNRVESVLILVGIGGWMAVVGWLVAGATGIVWTALGAMLVLLIQPIRSTALLKALFNAVPLSPSQAPELCGVMRELARRAGLQRVPPLLFIPRPELIALSTGWGLDAAIAVSEGMLRALPSHELAAVLAHETSHLRAGDLKLLRLAEAAGRFTRTLSLFSLLLALFYLPGMGLSGEEMPLLPLLLLIVAPIASDLLTLKLSRTREFGADAGGAALTGDPESLIRALVRIETLQGGNWERLTRGGGFRWFNWIRTHPTTRERLARLRELTPPPMNPWLTLPETLTPGGRPRDWPS